MKGKEETSENRSKTSILSGVAESTFAYKIISQLLSV